MELVRNQAVQRAGAALVAVYAVLVLSTASASGQLIGHFNITRQVAGAIVTLIVSGGGYLLGVLYPFVLPAVITVKTLVSAFGTAYAIGW